MSTYPITKSPVTEEEVETARGLGGRIITYFHNGGQIIFSDSLRSLCRGHALHLHGASYSPEQVNAGLNLLRSRFWRTRGTPRGNFLIATRGEIDNLREHPRQDGTLSPNEFQYLAIEDTIQEAESITFTQKCQNTLENLFDHWSKFGSLPENSHMSLDENNQPWFHERSEAKEEGVSYACDSRTAPIVYQSLSEQGLIRGRIVAGQFKGFELTPAAMLEVEKARAGRAMNLNRGFFIRKWDPKLDKFFLPIMDEVRAATGCEIKAVWERQKNEKLDELILRRIREASVIVLDVTGERFNVGLEAGYAIALKKQIVLIADKLVSKGQLPFDIRTLNCFFYSRDDPGSLTEKLIERALDALEEAKIGTH